MTEQELIAELKLKNPKLTYGVNDEVFEMSVDEYEATIKSWAAAAFEKQQKKDEAEVARQIKIAAYRKMGLTEAEIEALLPTPKITARESLGGN